MTESAAREHRTVSRVTGILESVAREGGARMHELAATLDAPKSSVFGLVKGLVSTGYLVEDSGVYRLGPALANLSPAGKPDIVAAARPSLEDLRAEFDETATLSVGVGDALIYLDTVESGQLIRYSPPLRVRRPLYPPSAGKVLLAYLPERRRETYLASVLPEDRIPAARAELDLVRADGVAFNRGETLPDVSAAARPVLIGGGPVAVIAVAGPTSRILDRLPAIAEALIDATAAVAGRLSGRGRQSH
ncbi:IclR family transcriptional regulator [Amycolatopsis sp. NPDC058986]|uniref:IclR family transcriptional regulator n=1 Tax=unclassified Amycolatopsis TaxID=2618356 RepID=UPI00366BE992